MMFSFKAIIASRGYHVYKETSWPNAKLNNEVKVELETDAKSLSTDPYACAIKVNAFLLHRLENSGTYSMRNLSLCLFFY